MQLSIICWIVIAGQHRLFPKKDIIDVIFSKNHYLLKNKNMKTPINKYVYVAFLVLAAYYIFVGHRYMDAATNMGISLIFDPFNSEQKWNDRPKWQKVWLIVHLGVLAALFGLGVGLDAKLGLK